MVAESIPKTTWSIAPPVVWIQSSWCESNATFQWVGNQGMILFSERSVTWGKAVVPWNLFRRFLLLGILDHFTKASLLAGVCFPLGMYWGQSFWSRSDLSHRNVPFKWFNHLILTPPPLGGFNSRWVHGPVSCFELLFLGLVRSLQQFHFQIQCVFKKESAYFFSTGDSRSPLECWA